MRLGLRTKILSTVIVTILAGFLAVHYSARHAAMLSYAEIERQQVSINLDRAVHAIQYHVNRLDSIAMDWGAWSDTRDYVLGKRPQFSEENLQNTRLANFVANFMIFVAADRSIVNSVDIDLESGQFVPRNEELISFVVDGDILTTHDHGRDSVAGILALKSGPVILSSAPITDNDSVGPVVGSIIIGRRLDDHLIRRIQNETKLSIRLFAWGDPNHADLINRVTRATADGAPSTFEADDDYLVRGFRILSDLRGEPAAVIELSMPREVYQQGLRTIGALKIAILIIGGLVLMVVMALVEWGVLRPITRVSNEVRDVARNPDPSRRLVERGGTEFVQLAGSVNQMLESLERGESELRENERLLQALIDTAPLGISLVEGRTLRWANSEMLRMTGRSREELAGQPCRVLCPDTESYDQSVQDQREAIERSGKGDVRTNWARKDGSTFPCQLFFRALNPRKPADGLVVMARDITEKLEAEKRRERMERHLWQAQKMDSLRTLAGSIAHNFNNLLQTIIGYQEFIQEDLPRDSAVWDYMETSNLAARRAADLSAQMLTYVGQVERRETEIHLDRFVREMEKFLSDIQPENVRIETQYEAEAEAAVVKGDPALLQQVLMNLINNGMEAVGEGQGLITVSVGARFFPLDALRHSVAYSDQAEGYYAYIEVRDNGSGITPDVLGRVFDPYFTTRFTGRGLGLAVVLGILRGHEGLILVQSEPGRGSSFQLLLPIVQAPQKEETPKIDQADAGEKFSGVALVVEGDKDARNVAEIMLRRLGLEPISAIDPLEALLLFEKHQHETRFILADLASLRRGAAESLKNMREMNPAVPIILISSQPPGMEPEPPAEGVFDAVLPKPYQKRDLVEALEAAQKKRGRPRA